MSELGRGVDDVSRGFRFLNKHPRLWAWVIAPALITLVLMIAAIIGLAQLIDPIVVWMTGWLPDMLEDLVRGLLWLLVVIALGAGALVIFVAVVGVVAGPFNEMLSEAVEARLTGKPGPKFSLRAFVQGVVVGLGHAARRLFVAFLGFFLLLVLQFVPIIGTIAAAVIGFWLASRAAAYDCYDAVLSRREFSYAAKLDYLAKYRARTFGLGATVTALLLVPGVNLLALGLGAAGATIAAHERR
jgi:CysZ protein